MLIALFLWLRRLLAIKEKASFIKIFWCHIEKIEKWLRVTEIKFCLLFVAFPLLIWFALTQHLLIAFKFQFRGWLTTTICGLLYWARVVSNPFLAVLISRSTGYPSSHSSPNLSSTSSSPPDVNYHWLHCHSCLLLPSLHFSYGLHCSTRTNCFFLLFLVLCCNLFRWRD